jgi:hypothetical protein
MGVKTRSIDEPTALRLARVARSVPYGDFVQCNIFYCNASKTGV